MAFVKDTLPKTINTGKSLPVTKCQSCGSEKLYSIIFLGYLPPVNTMQEIGSIPKEQPSYPANLLYCYKCHLVQLGLIVDPIILFPKSYPYTSSTTKVLRENFAELYNESSHLIALKKEDLIIDIGSNDGNLLNNFKLNHRVLGITPETIGKIAIKNGIPTIIDYFTKKVAIQAVKKYGRAKIVTLTNAFAHIENVHELVENIKKLLATDGVFISESHYLLPLIKTLQYDTIYHEHLRYYSLTSLNYLFKMHGLEVFHAKEIPSHGGSIRVYAAKPGMYEKRPSVHMLLGKENKTVTSIKAFEQFRKDVALSKTQLYSLLFEIKKKNKKIYGISAPSRGTTLASYTGLDNGIIDFIMEVDGSYKTGKYLPGTLIPVVDEKKLFNDQPDYAFLFSWHIADELISKLKAKGYKGKFIIPLPNPRIVS
jgi:hypothetical protein